MPICHIFRKLPKTSRSFLIYLPNLINIQYVCNKTTNLTDIEYEKQSEKTLLKLTDYFETLPDLVKCDSTYDVTYSMGVLTANVGVAGIYVINKQTPNRQIWLSSPISGPKRYDFYNGNWIYNRDGISLYENLEKELQKIFKSDKIKFSY